MPTAVTTTHKNSRKISIRRKYTFAEGVQDKAPDFMAQSKKSIGSYFESKNSHAIGSGLSFAERDLLMPYLIDLPKTDREFMDKSRKFFESISTKVPFEDPGLTLEIGLELDNDKEITFFDEKQERYNIPINVMEYVRYRHLIKHPWVALSETEAKRDPLKYYFVYDPTEVIMEVSKINKAKDESLNNYLKLKDNLEKVNGMLTLFKIDPRMYHGPNEVDQKVTRLRELAEEKPVEFNMLYADELFEEKFMLQGMLDAAIIRQIGNQFIFVETGKILGNTKEEMLYYFKDPKNSDIVVVLKGHLQEARKIKVSKPTAKTRTPVGR